MTDATITLKGILAGQPSLFDDLQIPATLDRDTMIGRICMRCNNLRPLYPDGPYFQAAIGIWSKSRLEVWEELEKTRHYDYTPIHNYDRHETEQTIQDGTYKDNTEPAIHIPPITPANKYRLAAPTTPAARMIAT